MPKTRIIPAPPAVFLPAAAEEVPDLAYWTPSDKHCVLEFLPPDLEQPLELIHGEMNA